MSTASALAVVSDKPTLENLMANQSFQESLRTVLPKHLTPERILKMALVAASRQPLLYKCTQSSILQALMKSAELGLDCSGTLGRAYLVPYFNNKISAYECQFIPGYQGLIELARRSGNIARIESRVVHENDGFNVEYGLDQKLVHKPAFSDRGKVKCVYAVAELTDGSRQIEVMTIEEVEAIRQRSKAKDNGPWKTDYSEMARKTVIRRITKYLPLSTELTKALEADDEQFANGHDIISNIHGQATAGVAGVKERLSIVAPAEPPNAGVAPEVISEPPAGSVDMTTGEVIEVETVSDETVEAEAVDPDESKLVDMRMAVKDALTEKVGGMASDQKNFLRGKVIDNESLEVLTDIYETLQAI